MNAARPDPADGHNRQRSQESKDYHDRLYRCYLVLGHPSAPPVWLWHRWLEVARVLDPVVQQCRDKPMLRVGQFTKEGRKEVKFGRLIWSASSFEKWTHDSPATEGQSGLWNFFNVEVSAPSISVAWRSGTPPDFFMVVANEGWIGPTMQPMFNPRVFIALATDMPVETHQDCRGAVRSIEQLVGSRLTATIERTWGQSVGTEGAFQRAIQDIAHVGLFKLGQPHARPLGLDTLAEDWELLS